MPIQITKNNWLRYVKALAKIDETAGDLVTEYLAEHSILSEEGMRDLLDFVYGVVTKYGEGSAELACLMYDASAKAQGASVPPAEPAPTATYPETAKAVRGSMLDSPSGAKVSDAAKRLVKQAGVDTTMQNAIRDGAEFAWVPQGDTCSFCLMLASNGWQHASKKALKKGHAEHIHANCDCTYAVRFDGKSGVKGYDPNEYKALYDNAEGDNWREKMNSMRREHYAENKDRINEQKREAYERRNEIFFLRNNLPRGYKDERNIGAPISQERLNDIVKKAYSNSIHIGGDPDSLGNFELYCGDPEVLESVVYRLGEDIAMAKEKGWLHKNDYIVLNYDNVLGYDGKRGVVDVDAYANTKGKTITLNKFMFDDTDYLISKYQKDMKPNEETGLVLFAKGTTHQNIVDHEFGHIIDRRNKGLKNKVLELLQIHADHDNITLDEYMQNNISIYAAERNDAVDGSYTEIIAELFSMSKGREPEFANWVLGEIDA